MTDPMPTPEDRHDAARALLPWYVTGRLDPDERAVVDAHLADCADCTADLARERLVGAAVATTPIDVDIGWQRLRARIAPQGHVAPGGSKPDRKTVVPIHRHGRWPRVVGLAIAAQFAILAIGIGLVTQWSPAPTGPAAAYRVLGSDGVSPRGNMLLMIDARTSVGRLSALAAENDARIVDGPTAAGAFVLAVPDARRDRVLAALRAAPGVTLAEPVEK